MNAPNERAVEPQPDGDEASPYPTLPPRALVDDTLARIAESQAFRRSRQHRRLLAYLVAHALDRDTAALKETVLACEVFGRDIGSFDPAVDTIVRVEARRLRQRLQRFYAEEGRAAAVEIALPVGSYVPTLRLHSLRRPAAPLEARDLVERGYQFLREGSEEGLVKALDRFETAIRVAPDHAPAYTGAARVWNNLAGELLRAPMPSIDHASEALQRSLQLDPEQSEALTLLGAITHRYYFDWAAAEPLFKRAIRMAPAHAFARMGYGAHLRLQGLADAAEHELQQARQLDPHYLGARWQMVLLRITQRRYDQARREIAALLDLVPDYVPALHIGAFVNLLEGHADLALAQYREIDAAAPRQTIGLAGIGQALGMLGDHDGVEATLRALRERFRDQYVSPCQLALIELRRGELEPAMHWLEEAARLRDSSVIFITCDPSYDALRGDARFETLLARHRRTKAT
ncbi:hypothetical protein BH10PSE17_BH10PSE17_33540 [soil metagenome]